MEILIVGAGIGGLALANGLVADGHRVQVLERADEPRTDGAAVTVFSNGAAAAAGLGVPLDGLGATIDAIGYLDPDGRPFAQADLTLFGRWTGHGVATVPRAALLRHLATGLRRTRSATASASSGSRRPVPAPRWSVPMAYAGRPLWSSGRTAATRSSARSTLGDGDPALNGWVQLAGPDHHDARTGGRRVRPAHGRPGRARAA